MFSLQNETSVDSIITGVLPLLKRFILVDDGLVLKIIKRGMAPEGGGQVEFQCPSKKQLKSVQVSEMLIYNLK